MGINFPNSPSVGTQWPSPAQAGLPVYQWDGEKWTAGPPALPDGLVHYDIAQTLTETQKAQARSNVYAAPFDALAYSGMQVNGSCEVSQERPAATGFAISGVPYVQDSWRAYISSAPLAATAYPAQSTGGLSGFQNCISMSITTPKASLGVNDYIIIDNQIEGYRVSRLGWGTSNPQPLSIGFWVYSSIPGIMTVGVGNGADNRAYLTNVTINAANTWEYKALTVPGDSAGTWDKSNGVGIKIRFCFGAGTNVQGAAGAWTPAVYYATSTTTNFGAAANAVTLTGLIVLPGIELPNAARAPFIMRPFDAELVTCRRYYQKSYDYATAPGTAALFGCHVYYLDGMSSALHSVNMHETLSPPMCKTPAVTSYSPANTNASGKVRDATAGADVTASVASIGQSGFNNTCTLFAAATVINFQFQWTADARL